MRSRVLVIGAGPVGLTTALLLARHGLRVTIVERRAAPDRGVRAVALDDESLRIWQACGLEQRLRTDWDGGPPGALMCRYLSPAGRMFLGLRQDEGAFGYPHAVAVHEGRIAATLDAAARRCPDIVSMTGCAVHGLSQDAEGVSVEFRAGDGPRRVERADWMVACDGGDSTVRRLLGVDMPGMTLPAPWLVANIAEPEPVLHATIRCDPRRPSVMMSVPHGVRRVECMLASGEAERVRRDPDAARALLAEVWPEAARLPVLESAVLHFEARIAARWRTGRVFLAGDAAHRTPPFAGQGLAAGLRDAANLSFKIAGVAQGWLDAPVLDSYETERRPHQVRLIRLALRLGRLMAPRSMPVAIAVQGAVRMAGALPFARRLLHMRGRAIQPRYADGFIGAGRAAGSYLPQPSVIAGDGTLRRLDDLLGSRMTLVAMGAGRDSGALGGLAVAPGDTVLVENRDFTDPGGVLQRAFGRRSVVLVRPDRVVHTHFESSRARVRGSRSLR